MGLLQSVRSSVTFQDLPNEVLQTIFRYLNLSERKNASLVCRRWNDNAMRCSELVLRVDLESENYENVVNTLMKSERPYKYLAVSDNVVPVRIYEKFSNCLETLRISSKQEFSSPPGLNFLSHLHPLKTLVCLIISNMNLAEEFHLGKHKCDYLKVLVAENVLFDNFKNFNAFISTEFPRLVRLHLQDCVVFGPFHFSCLPALEELQIDFRHDINCSVLKDFESLPKLRLVTLYCSGLDKMEEIEQDFRLKQIRKLDIRTLHTECHLL